MPSVEQRVVASSAAEAAPEEGLANLFAQQCCSRASDEAGASPWKAPMLQTDPADSSDRDLTSVRQSLVAVASQLMMAAVPMRPEARLTQLREAQAELQNVTSLLARPPDR